jgi:lysophospholipase L1-like esterase
VRLGLGLLVSMCAAAGCAPQRAFEPGAPNDPHIRYTGRFDTRAALVRVSGWPGTQIDARFTGTSLLAVLTETPTEDQIRDLDRINVVVDGGPARVFALAEGRHVYPIAGGLRDGEHSVQIWKRTEGVVGEIAFEGFVLAPGQRLLALAKAPRRRIEVIGDSISAGYGNEGSSATCHWDAATENSALTYGAFAARELGAAYSVAAWSGKGLLHNYDPNEPETLPEIFERVLPADPTAGVAPVTPHPDAVVINVGTNDMATGIPDASAFHDAYLNLLRRVRARHQRALIVIAFGPMLAEDAPQLQARTITRAWMKRIEADFRAQIDDHIASLELWIDPQEGLGCDSHPTVRTHQRMGKELAALLRDKLEW